MNQTKMFLNGRVHDETAYGIFAWYVIAPAVVGMAVMPVSAEREALGALRAAAVAALEQSAKALPLRVVGADGSA